LSGSGCSESGAAGLSDCHIDPFHQHRPRQRRAPGERSGVNRKSTDVTAVNRWAPHTVRGFLAGLARKGIKFEVLDRVRQVGADRQGAKGSCSVYRLVAEAEDGHPVIRPDRRISEDEVGQSSGRPSLQSTTSANQDPGAHRQVILSRWPRTQHRGSTR
jgi:hypothetical protein